jgi:hypothetical protein
MRRAVAWVGVGLLLAGCKSGPLGPYTSPRVSGQVLDAHSRQALAGVKVVRGRQEKPSSMSPPKGGEVLMQKVPVETDEEGRFTLDNQRVLSVFRGSSWDQVRLTFIRPGYETLRTNYSTLRSTNSLEVEPSLNVGVVLLQPVSR